LLKSVVQSASKTYIFSPLSFLPWSDYYLNQIPCIQWQGIDSYLMGRSHRTVPTTWSITYGTRSVHCGFILWLLTQKHVR